MTQSSPKLLGATVAAADWKALSPHAARGALIWVSPDLPLETVAKAIAEDRSAVIALWINATLIQPVAKPTTDEQGAVTIGPRQHTPTESDRFNSIIVQPFVLIQGPITEPQNA